MSCFRRKTGNGAVGVSVMNSFLLCVTKWELISLVGCGGFLLPQRFLDQRIVFLKGVTFLLICRRRLCNKKLLQVGFHVCFSGYVHAVITAWRQRSAGRCVCVRVKDALQSGLSSHSGMHGVSVCYFQTRSELSKALKYGSCQEAIFSPQWRIIVCKV